MDTQSIKKLADAVKGFDKTHLPPADKTKLKNAATDLAKQMGTALSEEANIGNDLNQYNADGGQLANDRQELNDALDTFQTDLEHMAVLWGKLDDARAAVEKSQKGKPADPAWHAFAEAVTACDAGVYPNMSTDLQPLK
jgi:hypothetical protein